MVASGASEFYLSSNSLGVHPYQQPQTPQQVLVVKAAPLAALAAPLLSQVGRMVAQQGVKGALSQGAKKVGQAATKEGMKQGAKQLAQEGAKKVASKEGMDAAMGKLRQEQQKKEAENRQMQQELMEAGRGGASTGSTTMG